MAIVLSEHAASPVDILRVVKMLLVHDLVEIDAGDTFAFDQAAVLAQREREAKAADRIFGLLPSDTADEFRAAWEEFESGETPEARFAKSMDCLGGGVLPNSRHQGGCWRESDAPVERVKDINRPIEASTPRLWEYAEGLIDAAEQGGFIRGLTEGDA